MASAGLLVSQTKAAGILALSGLWPAVTVGMSMCLAAHPGRWLLIAQLSMVNLITTGSASILALGNVLAASWQPVALAVQEGTCICALARLSCLAQLLVGQSMFIYIYSMPSTQS